MEELPLSSRRAKPTRIYDLARGGTGQYVERIGGMKVDDAEAGFYAGAMYIFYVHPYK